MPARLVRVLFFLMAPLALMAADLKLGEGGTSRYQIVTPAPHEDSAITDTLHQTARLLQHAFAVRGLDLPIASEADRDPEKPSLYLGDTAFAREHGVQTAELDGWDYVHKLVGEDLILAGRDHAPPSAGERGDPDYLNNVSYRFGTLKAVTEFMHHYLGTRFLYPTGMGLPKNDSPNIREWQVDNVGIHYAAGDSVLIPADLDQQVSVFTRYHTRTNRGADLYDIALNFFPKVDDALLGHSYDRAAPPHLFYETNPEWFALIGGKRYNGTQYCVSNPGFQEQLYNFHKSFLDKGFRSVNVLQPDGFRACQCDDCFKLYDTGNDWGEKLWILHRQLAERIQKDHPDKKVSLVPYTVTKEPPKSFQTFPDNVIIQTVDAISSPTDTFRRWQERYDGEYGVWLHNWIPHLLTRYTPMRTPLFIDDQTNFFHEYEIRGIFRDGRGEAYGMEGPVYYLFGRLMEAPELTAQEAMFEFCDAAFGTGGATMRRFYDRLYHGIELYSQYLGTHGVGWTYRDIYGRGHKHLQDPFQLFSFLYTPSLLEGLDRDLQQAEAKATSPAVEARLALVRREFEWIRLTAKVIHLYQAFELAPSRDIREHLLAAIDERNEVINGYYVDGRRVRPEGMDGWGRVLFPPPGHSATHLRLGYDRYQEPYASTALNWDTEAVRNSPLPGSTRLTVATVNQPLTLESKAWEKAQTHSLEGLPGATTFQVLAGPDHLFVRFQAALPPEHPEYESVGRDGDLTASESFDLYIGPDPAREVFYRFAVGPHPESRFDAARGLIDDPLNLRYNKQDPEWNGDWEYLSQVAGGQWTGLLSIPYATMGTAAPNEDSYWRANAGRVAVAPDGDLHSALWSTAADAKTVGEVAALGDWLFGAKEEAKPATRQEQIKAWRQSYYQKTFVMPPEWKQWENLIDLGDWHFRADPLEKGMTENWQARELETAEWDPIQVPGFWDETPLGRHEGYGWYRTTFTLPEDAKGKTLQIGFGSADEEAWVYINGELAREHTVASTRTSTGTIWETPFTVDVPPEQLTYGGQNTLTVRIRNTAASGGLWRPVIAQLKE